MSTQRVTWLHISDAHFGGPDMVGESQSVIAMLLQDLERLRDERELSPNFLFFTGDIAFGETSRSHLEDQYQAAEELLLRIEELFRIDKANVFLVPGNHDVNRTRVTEADTNWLDSHLDGGPDATRPIDQLWAEPETVAYQRYLERLENYAAFIQRAGLKHLLQNPRGLTYTHRRDVNGIDVAITGLNTAWSSCRDKEKGKLWLGQRQVRSSSAAAINADLAIALGHHPPGWFNEHEDPAWYQFLSSHYHFYLHGHEHNDWVVDQGGHVRVAAGCLYERNLATTGYNFTRLGFKERTAEVFLRQYDAKGGGWVPRIVYRKTDDSGRWKLGFQPLRRKVRTLAPPSEHPPSTETAPADSIPPPPAINVYEYFETGRAVRDEDRFIGRRHELRTALGALRARGAAIAIFGEAGFGKTSLALEVARIATGHDTKLCESSELRGCVPAGGFSHHVVYYSCRHGVDVNLETTLESVLRDRVDSHIGRITASAEFQRRLAAPEYLDVKREHEAFQRREINGGSALGLFRSLGSIAHEAFERELVVILDEFDVIRDKSGFATLIKELPQVKFVLVGTAVDVRLLVQEHASVPRQLAEGQIRLRAMSREELVSVITNEEARGKNRFSFTPQAKFSIADAARGVPYFVHFLGRHALDLASRDELVVSSPVKVELRHVEQALQERLVDLVDLEKEYVELVDGRWEREVVLKLLSARSENPIFLGNVRPIAERLGVKKVETPIRAFLRKGVLVREAEAMVQFSDTRLKVYARLREPVTDTARRRLSHHDSEPA